MLGCWRGISAGRYGWAWRREAGGFAAGTFTCPLPRRNRAQQREHRLDHQRKRQSPPQGDGKTRPPQIRLPTRPGETGYRNGAKTGGVVGRGVGWDIGLKGGLLLLR